MFFTIYWIFSILSLAVIDIKYHGLPKNEEQWTRFLILIAAAPIMLPIFLLTFGQD